MVPPPRFRRIQHDEDEPCKDQWSKCSPPPSPDSHGRAPFATALIIAGSVLAVLIICLALFLFVRRMRQQRRRRREEALLEAALAPAPPAPNNPDGVPDLEEEAAAAEQDEVVMHHVWHIRTVGLDEAAIESIALTRYRAGAGASDCAVCLGEFADGELLRLLPRCAHAFHVPCIDTWLRAHVNCPLCRTHVLDPAAPGSAADAEQSDASAGTDADTGQSEISSGERATEREQLDQQASEQPVHRHPGPPGRNFRRVLSMDSPSHVASAEEAAPEDDEQAGGEKQGTGGSVHHSELLSPVLCPGRLKNQRGMKRSLSVGSRWALVSRHGRRSSSLLPL